MAASKRQMNWSPVTFTIASSPTTLDGVTAVSFASGTQLAKFAGDGDRFNSMIVNNMNDPSANVTTGNPAQLMGLIGAVGSLSATHLDAKAATGGNIVYVLANAVCGNVTTSGNHGDFGTASIEIAAYSSDGTTNPLSFTRT